MDIDLPTTSLCINPRCRYPEDLYNACYRDCCESCGSDLLINGRYWVKCLLSDKTGFGKIYEAFDFEKKSFKILKVLKANMNENAKAVELFKREAEVLKQLKHPGIPQADGYFSYRTSRGLVLHCLAMEKIVGLNLEQWLQQQCNQPISQEEAIIWLKQLAEILDLVHNERWFHRDIKPSNIMVRDCGQLVLIDFGAAREETHTYLSKLDSMQSITAVVSAGYTPPEQMYGRAVPQSDFFALGRTFVYLLTGLHPSDLYEFYDDYDDYDVIKWRHAANISPVLADFLDNLMALRPGDRPLDTGILLKRIKEVERKLIKTVTASLVKKVSLANVFFTQTLLTGYSSFTGHSDRISCLKISPKSSVLVSGSNDNTFRLWDLGTGELIYRSFEKEQRIYGHSDYVNSVAISSNEEILVSGSRDKTIRIWNLRRLRFNWRCTRALCGHSDSVNSVEISPDGKTLVSGSSDNTIKIWNLEAGEIIRTLSEHSSSVMSVAISPDGKTLVSGSWDKTIKIWDLGGGELIRTLSSHSNGVRSVAISPNGQALVSASEDKTIKVWNLETGQLIHTLSGHCCSVNSVAINPDGQTLVSESWDRTIRIWNLETGELIRTLYSPYSWIGPVAISPDGQTLFGGTIDGTIKFGQFPQ